MALSRVRPGDLITADTFNSLVDELERLRVKVDGLGSTPTGDAPIIEDILFDAPTLREGTPIQIIGRNFRYSVGAMMLTFDDQQIVAFGRGSDDTRLLVNVPTLGVPDEGRNAQLRLTNGFGGANRTLFVMPFVLTTGDDMLDVLWTGQSPITAQPGQPLTLSYTLTSRVNSPLSIKVSTVVEIGGVPSNVAVTILGASGNEPVPDGIFNVGRLASTNFRIRLTIPADASGTITFAANATSGEFRGSDKRPVELGTAAPTPDPTITFNALPSTVTPQSGGSIDGSMIQLRQRVGSTLVKGKLTWSASVTIKDPAHPYVLEGLPPSGWELSANGVSFKSGPNPIELATFIPNQTPEGTGGEISIRPASASASTSGKLTLRFYRQGQTTDQRKTFDVKLLPNL